MRALGSAVVIVTGLLASSSLSAQPARDISAKRHPNLAAAQHFADKAFNSVSAAQRANEFDMDVHAAKAKNLLDEANNELKQAAEAANKNAK